MKNLTVCGDGFAELHSDEMETIHGGAILKIPSGFTWKAIVDFAVDHYDEIKKGLVDGWNFDQK